jgi:hypothetical protein
MRLKALVIAALAVTFSADVAVADSPVGTWTGETGQGEPFSIVIRESGGVYTGRAEGPQGTVDLSDIVFADGELSFTIHIEIEGQETAFSVEGAVDGNSFDGRLEIPNAGEFPIAMTREPVVELGNPVGTWTGQQENGERYSIIIAGSAGAYTGMLEGSMGIVDLSDVSFADGELSFSFSLELNGQENIFTAKGAIDGDSLEGSVAIPGGGEFPIAMTREATVDLSGAIGTWHGMINGAPATLGIGKSSSDTLEGTIETNTGVADLSEVDFSNGRLSFSARLDTGNGWMVLDFDGPIQGDDYGSNVNVEDLGIFPLYFSRAQGGDSEDSRASARSSDSGRSVGNWEVAFDIRGNVRSATLKIAKNDDGTLSGNWSSQLGTRNLRDVRDDGNSLTFNRTLELDGHSIDLSYSATIDGDAIHGTISTGQFGEIPFEGQRVGGGLAALAGTWNLAIDASGNLISITLNIAEEEGVVTGTWGSDRFGEVALRDATYDGGAIAFAVAIETPNGEFSVSFSGSVDGNELSGKLESDFGSFPVTGTKVE